MTSSLVGSEMCIRDSVFMRARHLRQGLAPLRERPTPVREVRRDHLQRPVSYTHLTLPTICSV
eukprot:3189956-Prorocentrum_lima.AAC.1